MGTVTFEVWFPVAPEVFVGLLTVIAVYLIYVAAKFIISIWTGS